MTPILAYSLFVILSVAVIVVFMAVLCGKSEALSPEDKEDGK